MKHEKSEIKWHIVDRRGASLYYSVPSPPSFLMFSISYGADRNMWLAVVIGAREDSTWHETHEAAKDYCQSILNTYNEPKEL